MTGAIASFSAMAVAGREISQTHNTFEIMTYRSLIGLVVMCISLTVLGKWQHVSHASLGVHLVRNSAHFAGQNLWFFAVATVPLAQVFALEFTTPLWVILLSPLVLGERLTPAKAGSAAMGFLGIIIITRPGSVPLSAGIISAASCAIFFAVTMMVTKILTHRERIVSILFWLTFMQLWMGVISCLIFYGQLVLPNQQTAPWLLLIGLAGLSAHFCLTTALSCAPATIVVPFDFVRLPAIAIVGMLLYQEAIDIWVFIGAVVIFASNYLNVYSGTRN
ncbi:MAG: DMT family transporter [Pseudomonadota bacterium]